MVRPKSLNDVELIPGELVFETEEFLKGYVGTVDKEGRIPKVGKEYAGKEVWIFIKKSAEDKDGLVGMGLVTVEIGEDGEERYLVTEKGKRVLENMQ